MTKLAMELSKVLFREEPKLLVADIEASGRASAEVANLLGCILATVATKCGQDAYETAMRTVVLKIHDSAMKTAEKAETMTPNTTTQ
jgi:uncharacterized membrane protein